MWFTVGAGATITDYFDYVPATTYDVVVSSTEGGSFTWVDNTTLASGGVGSYSFAVGDRLTFYASPYAGYYFHGIYATRYLINGVSDQPSVSFILGAAVNISAAFSLSSQNYSVAVSISPTPYGEVNASTTTFQLKDGVDYTFTFTVTSNFGPIGIGQFNVSETNVYNTIPPIFDISAAMGGSYNGLPIAALPIISIAHTPESNYGYALLNQPFSNGVFSFNITGAPVRYYEQYQGLEVTVYSSIDGSNFNSPMYALQWFYPEDLPATPTPAPGTTPTPTSSPYTHTIDFGLGTFNGYIMLMIGAIFTFLSILIFMKAFKVWVVGTMFLIVGLLMMSVSFPDLYGLVAWSIESIICTVFLYQAKEKRSK